MRQLLQLALGEKEEKARNKEGEARLAFGVVWACSNGRESRPSNPT
jgi:hypothetical protein